MWGKFKQLNTVLKIIIGSIAILAFPITILLFSCEMLIKSIKNKKIINIILSGMLVIFISSAIISGFTSPLPIEKSKQEEKPISNIKDKDTITKKDNNKKVEKSKSDDKEVKNNPNEESQDKISNKKVEEKTDDIKKYSAISDPVEKPVMNGFNTERIGTRLESFCAHELLKERELIDFYNEYVKNSNYNYITLNFGNGNGIVFSGNISSFTYGELDRTGSIINGLGYGEIKNNNVDYESK